MKQWGLESSHLLGEAYQELQYRFDKNNQNMGLCEMEKIKFELEFELNTVFDFFEKCGVYELLGSSPQKNRAVLMQMSIANIAKFKASKKIIHFFRRTNVQDWVMALLSHTSGVPLEKMNMGNVTSDEWRLLAKATGDLADAVFTIYEGEYVLDDFIAYCRSQYDEGICFDVIVIDGLSPQETKSLGKMGEVGEALLGLANDLQTSIITSTTTNKYWQKPKLRKVL